MLFPLLPRSTNLFWSPGVTISWNWSTASDKNEKCADFHPTITITALNTSKVKPSLFYWVKPLNDASTLITRRVMYTNLKSTRGGRQWAWKPAGPRGSPVHPPLVSRGRHKRPPMRAHTLQLDRPDELVVSDEPSCHWCVSLKCLFFLRSQCFCAGFFQTLPFHLTLFGLIASLNVISVRGLKLRSNLWHFFNFSFMY